jgi:hypothetical protein
MNLGKILQKMERDNYAFQALGNVLSNIALVGGLDSLGTQEAAKSVWKDLCQNGFVGNFYES